MDGLDCEHGAAARRCPAEPVRIPGIRAPHRLTLLGGFGLVVDGHAVELPVPAQRLTALLALGGRTGRSQVAGTLWPESSEARALACLRTVIWRLGRAAPDVLATDGPRLLLSGAVHVDLHRFTRSAAQAMRDPQACPDWSELIGVEGELLPDWTDEWLVPHRERVRQLRLHVLEEAASRLSAVGRFGLAVEAALAAVRADPLRESAHRAVIRVHTAEGNLVEAHRAYRACCAVLRRELGVAPSPLTTRVLEESLVSAASAGAAAATPTPPSCRWERLAVAR